jgi:hypothetical protein
VCHCVKLCHVGSIEALAQLAKLAKPRRYWLDGLHPKQRDFVDDPAKEKAALKGRRAGGTWAGAVGLYDKARAVRCLCPYIALSAVQARRIMWPVVKEVNEKYALGMKMNDHELIAEVPETGSQIFLVGGDDTRKVEALRGGKYGRIVIDEPGSFGKALLRYLHEDVLDAALMDLDGDMWFIGSPNAACAGHFHDLTTGANPEVAKIPTHHWTVLDNPNIPHAAEWLRRKREKKKWDADNPVYLREYMAQWVRDASSLVFRFDRARHMVDAVPQGLAGVVGVDLGASARVESMAFVTELWERHSKVVYTRRATKHANMNVSHGGDHLEKLMREFPELRYAVVDEGGLGKGYTSTWRQRAGLKVKAAEKRDKNTYIEFLNDGLDNDLVKLLAGPETAPLVDEIEILQWNEDRDAFDDRFADHAADAWLYGWRDCYAWNEKPKAPVLSEEQRIIRAAELQAARRKKPWYAR